MSSESLVPLVSGLGLGLLGGILTSMANNMSQGATTVRKTKPSSISELFATVQSGDGEGVYAVVQGSTAGEPGLQVLDHNGKEVAWRMDQNIEVREEYRGSTSYSQNGQVTSWQKHKVNDVLTSLTEGTLCVDQPPRQSKEHLIKLGYAPAEFHVTTREGFEQTTATNVSVNLGGGGRPADRVIGHRKLQTAVPLGRPIFVAGHVGYDHLAGTLQLQEKSTPAYPRVIAKNRDAALAELESSASTTRWMSYACLGFGTVLTGIGAYKLADEKKRGNW